MRDSDFKALETKLEKDLFWILFQPLVSVLKEMDPSRSDLKKFDRMQNTAEDALRTALQTGSLQYSDGQFTGAISATISLALRQLGARRDRRTGNYALDPTKAPAWLRAETSLFQEKARQAHEKLKKILDMMADTSDELTDKLEFVGLEPWAQAEKNWRQAALKVGLHPELRAPAQKKLAEEYNRNLKLKVKEFSKKAILDLRDDVEENAQAGLRFSTLIDRLERRHEITRTKAKFLARQETALYMSKFRKAQFGEMGITHYRWMVTHDDKLRDAHKDLHNRIFRYDDPPIVDPHTGRRANPGEDFNCRCVDQPIVEAMMEVA